MANYEKIIFIAIVLSLIILPLLVIDLYPFSVFPMYARSFDTYEYFTFHDSYDREISKYHLGFHTLGYFGPLDKQNTRYAGDKGYASVVGEISSYQDIATQVNRNIKELPHVESVVVTQYIVEQLNNSQVGVVTTNKYVFP